MPLTKPVDAFRDEVRTFLADEDAVALEVEVAPDILRLAAKIVAAVAQDEYELAPDLVIGVSTDFTNADAFAATVIEAVDAELSPLREDLEAADAYPLPPPPEADAGPSTARMVEYLERCGRAVVPFARRLVIALDVAVPPALTTDWLRNLLESLSRCASPWLKWVIFTEARRLAPEIECRRPGVVARVGGESARRRHREAAALGSSGWRERSRAVVVEGIPFVAPMYFYTQASRAIVRELGGEVPSELADEIQEWVGHDPAEVFFAEQCERIASAVLGPSGRLDVILFPRTDAEAEGLRESVGLLTRVTPARATCFIVVDPRLGGEIPAWRRSIPKARFALDHKAIETGLEEKLADPELPALERMRFTSAMSGIALAKDDPARALRMATDALTMAGELDSPKEVAMAWYTLGNTLFQCTGYDQAEDAYTQAATQAMDNGQDVVAGQSFTGIGHTLLMRERAQEASQAYEVARSMFAALNLVPFQVYAMIWKAEAAAAAGEHGEALLRFDEALATCKAGDPHVADSLKASEAEIYQRKARIYEHARMHAERRDCETRARELGATAPACPHP